MRRYRPFLLLGLVCGLVAVVLMKSIFWADGVASRLQSATRMPRVLRPALAGVLLGLIAIEFPHIIGVGYETTSNALTGQLLLREAIVFTVVKVAAVAFTMGGRMGGGMFSPSLMVGALTGLAYGMIATAIFPTVSGSETLYALAGTGALAAAVLGAPISTTLIVFELTGDWQTGLAVMVAVSLSTALASRMVHRSFFLTQLERRGVRLAAGPQAYLLSRFRVRQVMRAPSDSRAADEAAQSRVLLAADADNPASIPSPGGTSPLAAGSDEVRASGAYFDDIKDAFESWDYTVTARIGIQGKVGDGGVLGAHLNVASSLAGIDTGQPDQAKLKNNGIGFAVEYTHSLGN